MDIYTSDTAYIIRQDMQFSDKSGRERARVRKARLDRKAGDASLERVWQKMTEDDGRSSFGTYKCPIF